MPEPVNIARAKQAWSLLWNVDWVTAVCFLGPTRRLAAGNNLGEVLLCDLPDAAGGAAPMPVRKLTGHTNAISRLLSSPDGRWLISASYDHTIRYWDMQAPTSGEATLTLNSRARYEAAGRRYSKMPAAIEAKVKTQTSARTLTGHREWVTGMCASRDGQLLLSGDDDGQVVLWDLPSGKEVRRWKLSGWSYAVALAPDKKQAFVSERRPLVFDSGRLVGAKLWDVTAGKPQRDLGANFKDMYISAAAYSPDGKLLALARGGEAYGQSGKTFLIDPSSGKKLRETAPGHLDGATDVIFHPDGKHLASTGRDTVVRIWNSADGKLVKELGKPRGGQSKDWFHAVSFSADGRWVAAADMAGFVPVWSLF